MSSMLLQQLEPAGKDRPGGLGKQEEMKKHDLTIIFSIFFFKDFIHERHRLRQRHRQREKQAPRREPDVGLDPGSPGSRPGPKAALNH